MSLKGKIEFWLRRHENEDLFSFKSPEDLRLARSDYDVHKVDVPLQELATVFDVYAMANDGKLPSLPRALISGDFLHLRMQKKTVKDAYSVFFCAVRVKTNRDQLSQLPEVQSRKGYPMALIRVSETCFTG